MITPGEADHGKKEIPIQNVLAQFFWYVFMLFYKNPLIGCCRIHFFFFSKWLQGPLSPLRFSSHLGLWLLHNPQDTGYWVREQFKLAGIKEWREGEKKRKKSEVEQHFLQHDLRLTAKLTKSFCCTLFQPSYRHQIKCFHHWLFVFFPLIF